MRTMLFAAATIATLFSGAAVAAAELTPHHDETTTHEYPSDRGGYCVGNQYVGGVGESAGCYEGNIG